MVMDGRDGLSVVQDDVSRFGLRRLHVIRMGGKVEKDDWLVQIEGDGGEVKAVLEYEEEELGLWHLRIFWKVREAGSSTVDGDAGMGIS